MVNQGHCSLEAFEQVIASSGSFHKKIRDLPVTHKRWDVDSMDEIDCNDSKYTYTFSIPKDLHVVDLFLYGSCVHEVKLSLCGVSRYKYGPNGKYLNRLHFPLRLNVLALGSNEGILEVTASGNEESVRVEVVGRIYHDPNIIRSISSLGLWTTVSSSDKEKEYDDTYMDFVCKQMTCM